jgi:hypothetical protein
MTPKPIVPIALADQALITSCPGLTAEERLLLVAINRYDIMSKANKKVAGCYASTKTLAAEIGMTHATTRRRMASLIEKGVLVNLGEIAPGSTMRRRVCIPKAHVEAFYAKREAKKKRLLQANERAGAPETSSI